MDCWDPVNRILAPVNHSQLCATSGEMKMSQLGLLGREGYRDKGGRRGAGWMQWITSDTSCSNALQTSSNKIALLQTGQNEIRCVFFLGCWGLQPPPPPVEPGSLTVIWGASESKILLNFSLSENMCWICTNNNFEICYKHKFRTPFINHSHFCYTGWFNLSEIRNNNYKWGDNYVEEKTKLGNQL